MLPRRRRRAALSSQSRRACLLLVLILTLRPINKLSYFRSWVQMRNSRNLWAELNLPTLNTPLMGFDRPNLKMQRPCGLIGCSSKLRRLLWVAKGRGQGRQTGMEDQISSSLLSGSQGEKPPHTAAWRRSKRQRGAKTRASGPLRHVVHGCQMAKFDLSLSLDCARVEGVGAKSKERKGSNFAA